MNTSPFEIFRRNLKPLMVLLTGLALLSFVVLPAVDTYLRRNSVMRGDAVVAKFGGKSLTQSRVDYFTRNHNETIGFLTKLAQATIDRGGVPKTAGFQYDPQTKRIVRLGINESPGAEVSVRTMMFAAEANRQGFELDDSAIQSWLDRFTDGLISDGDITAMLMSETQNRMGRPHLYEQLRSHLLADVYLKRGYAGLYSGDNPSAGALMTPAEQWAAFKKLNRKATIDAYAVLVNDFLDQTNENPSQQLILATYEEGKDRDVNDQSPDPAFHRRYTASFEYLEGGLQAFLDQEVAKLKEEDIRAEYEKRLAGGAFKLPEEALDKVLQQPAQSEEKTTQEAAAAEAGSDKATVEPEKTEAESEPPAAEPDTPQADSETPPADPAESSQPSEEKTSEEKVGEEKVSEDEQGFVAPKTMVRLVALQDQAAEGGEESPKPDENEGAEQTTDDSDKPAQQPSEDDSEGTEQNKAADQPAESADESADQKQEEMKQDEPPADPAGDAAEQETAEESAADQEQQESKPKVESFEDVRERLAEEMAFPAARQRLNDATAKIYKQMQSYFNQRAIHESNVAVGQAGKPPTKPDLQALAKEVGFELKAIGPYDQVGIAEDPIATSMDPQSQFGSRGPNFALMMYGYSLGPNIVPPHEKYSPLKTADFMTGNVFVSWKTDDREAFTPSLAEAKEEVIQYIRMKEARGLAQDAADQLADKASKQPEKPFADLIPEDKRDNFYEGLGPFSWLDSFGRGVTMGNVPELDSVGEDFMAAVFETALDHYQIAPNQPQRVFYVVRPTKFEPSIDELRQQFRQPANRRMITAVDAGIGSVLGEFYESIDEQAGFADLMVSEQ